MRWSKLSLKQMCPMGVTHHHRLHQMGPCRQISLVAYRALKSWVMRLWGRDLLKNQPGQSGPCIVSTWVIDWTLMRGTKLIDLSLVSHAGYWFSHSPSSIWKMTINVALLFGFDWFVVFVIPAGRSYHKAVFSVMILSLICPLPVEGTLHRHIWLLFSLLLLQILFMNKLDLFQDKILHSGRHLRLYLPQFKGGPDVYSVTMSSFNIFYD